MVQLLPSAHAQVCTDGSVRLQGGHTSLEGRVEFCVGQVWGTVCDNDWDFLDAIVVCRQLGHNTLGAEAFDLSQFGPGVGDVVIGEVMCNGTETTLSSCSALSNPNCRHVEDAGVRCRDSSYRGECGNATIRLVGGGPYDGRVEVCRNGLWGRVCGDSWTYLDAIVACRQLGHQTLGAVGLRGKQFGHGRGNIHLKSLECKGTESSLDTCPIASSTSRSIPSCSNNLDDAAVMCQEASFVANCTAGLIRLVANQTETLISMPSDQPEVDPVVTEGRVEVCINGVWGTICSNNWSREDALVACRHLGFSGARVDPLLELGGGSGNIFLGSVSCNGSESMLLDCPTTVNAHYDHTQDAGMACTPDGCDFFNCFNGGSCYVTIDNEPTCSCEIGFTGPHCETALCSPSNTCQNAAECVPGFGQVSCVCLPGYSGESCEEDLDHCTNLTCNSHGACSEGAGVLMFCSCALGFTGSRCEIEVIACSVGACQNNGTCIEEIGLVTSCVNNETCVEEAVANMSCACPAGFSGKNCEVSLLTCQSSWCRNGGTCFESLRTVTACVCPPGFTGSRCETDMDYCESSTCRNGGTCVEEQGRNTTCQCLPGFTGPVCSMRTGEELTLCLAEMDSIWKLSFPETAPGQIASLQCSLIRPGAKGEVRRRCLGIGEWDKAETSECQSPGFSELQIQASTLDSFDSNVMEELARLTAVEDVETPSLFSRDLQIANAILELENNIDNLAGPISFTETHMDVFNNLLEINHAPGWLSFVSNEVGSEMLLLNVERYGQFFAFALESDNVNISHTILETKTIMRKNIILQVELVDPREVERVLFPPNLDLNKKKHFGDPQSIISQEFLLNNGAAERLISVVNARMANLNTFLPRTGLSSSTQTATEAISTQLVRQKATISLIPASSATPTSATDSFAAFRFTTKMFLGKEVTNPTCVFFNLSNNIAKSAWSSVGLTTEATFDEATRTYDVICKSPHVTSFAVLLDVNDVSISDMESNTLSVITIIGCTISIIFLFLTIAFFVVVIGKTMFTGVHYFIHLNLSIALMLGYIVFLAGVDTAIGNKIGCTIVAALLHYLFTAVFCWMLCEGIMLYLMLVVVFSRISKKWWLFFLIGWGSPIFIVAVSVGTAHHQYGTSQYCWISVERSAIWAFASPMLFIVLINAIFLGAALWSLFRLKRAKNQRNFSYSHNEKTVSLFKQLFLDVVVLLPLLGLTWVFGLLSVNKYTTFFAWIFTILNSFQGLFIFVFHVLRNDKGWNKLVKFMPFGKHKNTTNTNLSSKNTGSITKPPLPPLPTLMVDEEMNFNELGPIKHSVEDLNFDDTLDDIDESMFEKEDMSMLDVETAEHDGKECDGISPK